jgi:acetyltransferase-like isoleucine patch superfamily enzyme
LRRGGAQIGDAVRFRGAPIVQLAAGSKLTIGSGVTLVSHSRWTALGVSHACVIRTLHEGASITIGDQTGVSGASICAAGRISIGKRVLIGADAMIADTDFHPLDSLPRSGKPVPEAAPTDYVDIGDDVFIGARAVVLRGVTIGRGSVIGAGSVVTRSVPPMSIAAGVPARVIRKLKDAE